MLKHSIDISRIALDPESKEVAKELCLQRLEECEDMLEGMKLQIAAEKLTCKDVVILLANADDAIGKHFVPALNLENELRLIRDEGAVPIVATAADRAGMQQALEQWDKSAAHTLRSIPNHSAVIVFDYGAIAVFLA